VDQVLSQCIAAGKATLDRHELPARVALEADEEEAGVELPGVVVDAVVIDPMPVTPGLTGGSCRPDAPLGGLSDRRMGLRLTPGK
jgi:hypothetical protein